MAASEAVEFGLIDKVIDRVSIVEVEKQTPEKAAENVVEVVATPLSTAISVGNTDGQ